MKLQTFKRDKKNKDLVNAVIIRKNETLSISLKRLEVNKALEIENGFRSTIFDVDGYQCLVRDLQFDYITDEVMHVDFLEVTEDRVIDVKIPVKFINRELSEDIKLGSVANKQCTHIKVRAKVKDLPKCFLVDLQEQKRKFKLKDIVDFESIAQKVEFINTSPEESIASIKQSRGSKMANE